VVPFWQVLNAQHQEDITDKKSPNELFHAAAGKTGLLKYLCHGCRCEILTELPFALSTL